MLDNDCKPNATLKARVRKAIRAYGSLVKETSASATLMSSPLRLPVATSPLRIYSPSSMEASHYDLLSSMSMETSPIALTSMHSLPDPVLPQIRIPPVVPLSMDGGTLSFTQSEVAAWSDVSSHRAVTLFQTDELP